MVVRVIPYVILVGACPFEDPEEPKDFRKTINRILNVQYTIPDNVQISEDCRHLISRIFVADPKQFEEPDQQMQHLDVIMQIISDATIPPAGFYNLDIMDEDMDDLDSDDLDVDPDLDIDSSGEVIYPL